MTMRFKLLAGLHVEDQKGWTPTQEQMRVFNETGVKPKCPEVTYRAGDIIESETDLTEKFGHTKFLRLQDKKSGGRRNVAVSPEPVSHFDYLTKVMGLSAEDANSIISHSLKEKPVEETSSVSVSTHSPPQSSSPPSTETVTEEGEDEEDDEEDDTPHPSAIVTETPHKPSVTERDYFNQLGRMTVDQLRRHAEEEEVDLKGLTRRDDILRRLREEFKK